MNVPGSGMNPQKCRSPNHKIFTIIQRKDFSFTKNQTNKKNMTQKLKLIIIEQSDLRGYKPLYLHSTAKEENRITLFAKAA